MDPPAARTRDEPASVGWVERRWGRPAVWTALAVAAAAGVFAANVLRAQRLPISIDEATTFEWYLLPSMAQGPAHLFRFDANNHFLNTLLERFSIAVLGVEVLPLRLPALAGGALYLGASVVVSRRIVGRGLALPIVVLLLAANPLVRDFSVAARGYGLALGFSMASVALLCANAVDRPGGGGPALSRWRLVLAGVGLGLTVASSLPFALVAVAIGCAFTLRQALAAGVRAALADVTVALALPAVVVFGAIAWPFLLDVEPAKFFLGFDRLVDTAWDLVGGSFFRDASAAHGVFVRAAPAALANDPAVGTLASVLVDGVVPAVLALLLVGASVVMLRGRRRRTAAELNLVLLVMLVLVPIVLAVLAHAAVGVHYPVARTALYEVPLVTLALAALAAVVPWHRLLRWPAARHGAVLAVGAVVLLGYATAGGGGFFHPWGYDAGNEAAFEMLQPVLSPRARVRVGASWILASSLNFYVSARAPRGTARIGSAAETRPADFDVFVVNRVDLPSIDTDGMVVLCERAGDALLVRAGTDAEKMLAH